MRMKDEDLLRREDVLRAVMKAGDLNIVKAVELLPAEHTEPSEITVEDVIKGLKNMISLTELDRELALKRFDKEMYYVAIRNLRILRGALELIDSVDETEIAYDDDTTYVKRGGDAYDHD